MTDGREGPVPTAGEPTARPRDLAVGLSKILRPWLVGLGLVGVVAVALALGANRPADPSFAGEAGSTSTTAAGPGFEERRILVGESCQFVQVASTPEQRGQGLKDRDDLGSYDGMLFEWDSTGNRGFTMSGVRFPLTIGFYDDAGTRVDALDMEPCPEDAEQCPTYSSGSPFRNALEVAQGQLPEGPLGGSCP